MRASIARPYIVVVSADKDRTREQRGSYGFVGKTVTEHLQKMYKRGDKSPLKKEK